MRAHEVSFPSSSRERAELSRATGTEVPKEKGKQEKEDGVVKVSVVVTGTAVPVALPPCYSLPHWHSSRGQESRQQNNLLPSTPVPYSRRCSVSMNYCCGGLRKANSSTTAAVKALLQLLPEQ